MGLYRNPIGGLEGFGDTLGYVVERATENLPQSGDGSLFTITGGLVIMTLLIGEVTTVIETQTNNALIKFRDTLAVADTDLCAALDITAFAVGSLLTISGIVTNALRTGVSMGLGGLISDPLVLSNGIVELECSASNTGQAKWTACYMPITKGAKLVAS